MKKQRLTLQELKVESFVTDDKRKGGDSTAACYASATFVSNIALSINEIGENNSWWDCRAVEKVRDQPSDNIILYEGGEACLLDEVIVQA